MDNDTKYKVEARQFFDDFFKSYRPLDALSNNAPSIEEQYSPNQLAKAKRNLENILYIGDEKPPKRVKYRHFYIGETKNYSDVDEISGMKSNLLRMFKEHLQKCYSNNSAPRNLLDTLNHYTSNIKAQPHNKWHKTRKFIPYPSLQNNQQASPKTLERAFTPVASNKHRRKVVLPIILSIPLFFLSSSSFNQKCKTQTDLKDDCAESIQTNTQETFNKPTIKITLPPTLIDNENTKRNFNQVKQKNPVIGSNTLNQAEVTNISDQIIDQANVDAAKRRTEKKLKVEEEIIETRGLSIAEQFDERDAYLTQQQTIEDTVNTRGQARAEQFGERDAYLTQQQTIEDTVNTRGQAHAEQFGERDAYYRSKTISISSVFNIGPLLDKNPANDIITLEKALETAEKIYSFNSFTPEIVTLRQKIATANSTMTTTGHSVFIMTADSFKASDSYFNALLSAIDNDSNLRTDQYARALTQLFSYIASSTLTENKPNSFDDTKRIASGTIKRIENAQQHLAQLGYHYH